MKTHIFHTRSKFLPITKRWKIHPTTIIFIMGVVRGDRLQSAAAGSISRMSFKYTSIDSSRDALSFILSVQPSVTSQIHKNVAKFASVDHHWPPFSTVQRPNASPNRLRSKTKVLPIQYNRSSAIKRYQTSRHSGGIQVTFGHPKCVHLK